MIRSRPSSNHTFLQPKLHRSNGSDAGSETIIIIIIIARSPTILTALALGLPLLCAAGPAAAQNCSCPPDYCCNKFGYCGTTIDYCGGTCQSGPCTGGGDGGGANVSSVVTDAFFNGIKNQTGNGCEGKNFYTRSAFLNAANAYPAFAHGGSEADGKREIAAFFAHVTYETGYLCYINEINGASRTDCDASNKQWPCVPGKKYYGRGPLQIWWNYNYGPAGRDIGFDGLGNPDKVAQDPVVSFKTAFWLWMKNAHGVMPQGFGATIMAINGGLECNGHGQAQMNARANYYKDYCRQFGVDPGNNITC